MKNKLTFDEPKLTDELRRIDAPLRVIFAAACAERQMPAYRAFHRKSGIGDPGALGHMLDHVWLNPAPGGAEQDQGQHMIESCMRLTPQEDLVQPWSEAATYAQNAGMAVIYALRARIRGEPQEAAWAARVGYESLDFYVMSRDPDEVATEAAEQRVLEHPLVQAELARQRRDLDDLRGFGAARSEEAVAWLRKRAKREGERFFTTA